MAYIPYPTWLHPEVLPGLPIRWYGIMYLVAFLCTYLLFMYQIRKHKLAVPSDTVLSLFFWAIVGLLIGARLLSVLIYDPSQKVLSRPWLIFWPFDENGRFTGLGGMSYHGGLIGAVTAIVIYCRVKKLDLWNWGDMIVYGLPLGYTFGRIGNFVNGELYGRVTDLPWGVVFPNAPGLSIEDQRVVELAARINIPLGESENLVNLPRHPSQLYEALFEGLVLWAVMWFFVRKRSPFKGFGVAMYLVLYGAVRFVIEYFREPDAGLDFVVQLGNRDNPREFFLSLLNFSMGQLLCAVMIAAGVVMILIFKHLDRRRPRAETFEIFEQPENTDSGRKSKRNSK